MKIYSSQSLKNLLCELYLKAIQDKISDNEKQFMYILMKKYGMPKIEIINTSLTEYAVNISI